MRISKGRRLFDRFRTDLEAHVRPAGHFTWLDAIMLNVSRGGICMTVRQIFPIGLKIEFEIQTVSAEGKKSRRRFLGTIMWRRGYRYGVQFNVAEMKKMATYRRPTRSP